MNIEIKDSERNVYLKQFYDGILYGPLESSVEKSRPWIKYYTVEELANPLVYRTMYEDLIYYNVVAYGDGAGLEDGSSILSVSIIKVYFILFIVNLLL